MYVKHFSTGKFNSPLIAAVIVAIAYSTFLLGSTFVRSRYNPSFYVTAGSRFADPARVPAGVLVQDNDGYDGQFFYRFALDPFTSAVTDFGITLEKPAYRHQRILYPLLVWALSLGSPALIPWMMLGVNLFGLCVIGWLGGAYAQSLKRHALWGLAIPFYPGFILTLTRDLAEIVAISFLLGSLLLLKRNRHILAVILICLAALARETVLLVAVGALLAYVATWSRRDGALREGTMMWGYFAAPVAVILFWQTALFYNWGAFPVSGGGGSIGVPFAGFVSFLLETAQLQTRQMSVWFVELVFIIGFVVVTLLALRLTVAPRYVAIAWALYFALGASLTRDIWNEDWGFLRALSEFYLFGALVVIGAGTKLRTTLFVGALLLWSFLAYDVIWYR